MKAILFDLDGTLIDSTEGIVKSFDYAFEAFGKTAPKSEDICSLIGHPLEYMFVKLGAKEDLVDAYIAKYKENYRQISTQTTKLLPQAKEAIELASHLAPIGVVTTKTAKYSKDILSHFGVLKHFSAIVGREDVVHPKPDPEPILKALEKLKIKPSKNVFMVGDTKMDMKSALDAGVNAVGLECGYGHKKDLLLYATNIRKNAFLAVDFIKKEWKKN